MQRTIKFRGKSYLGDWHYGMLSADLKHIVTTKTDSAGRQVDLYQVIDPSTIGQFTGLTDINGKDIYEGDILRYCPNHGTPVTAPVEWIGTSFQFVVDKESRLSATLFGFRPSMFMEIIGNRWDNPSLLKGGEE